MPLSIQSLNGVLNGCVGDQLERSQNPLATAMTLLCQHRKLDCQHAIQAQCPQSLSNRVVVLVHGLTNTEQIWDFPSPGGERHSEDNYGLRLQKEFGVTPIFARYNSGLPIKANGESLAQSIEGLLANYPIDIDYLCIIGFSMGGLISRHAQDYAEQQNLKWLGALKQCIYIGTPHEGAPLEKLADATSNVLSSFPITYVNHWADWFALRSKGIKDLRYGISNDNDNTAFNTSVKHCFVSGSLSKKPGSTVNRVLGDSLVRHSSAHPGDKPEPSSSVHFEGVHHIALAHNDDVYLQVKTWVGLCQERTLRCSDPIPFTDQPVANIPSDSLSLKQLGVGSAMLINDTYNQVLDSVQAIHGAVSDDSYSLLRKLPLVQVIEEQHMRITGTIFKGLKLSSSLTRDTLARLNKKLSEDD